MSFDLDSLLGRAITGDVVPGVVAVIADGRSLLYEGAFGVRDMGDGSPMRTDTIFRIASMTMLV
jgi:methyl acetate hydrolase